MEDDELFGVDATQAGGGPTTQQNDDVFGEDTVLGDNLATQVKVFHCCYGWKVLATL